MVDIIFWLRYRCVYECVCVCTHAYTHRGGEWYEGNMHKNRARGKKCEVVVNEVTFENVVIRLRIEKEWNKYIYKEIIHKAKINKAIIF